MTSFGVSRLPIIWMVGSLFSSPSVYAAASPPPPPPMVVQEVPETELTPNQRASLPDIGNELMGAVVNDGSSALGAVLLPGPLTTIEGAVVMIDTLVNLGKVAWDVVKMGTPSVDLRTDIATLVPSGIKNWSELEHWSPPVTKIYCAGTIPDHYLNCSRQSFDDPEQFWFRLVFVPGGDYQGRGKYLAGVTLVPAQLHVGYLHHFNSKVQVLGMSNFGTPDDPVAGLMMSLTWSSDQFFRKYTQNIDFVVKGTGEVSTDAKPSVALGKPLIHFN